MLNKTITVEFKSLEVVESDLLSLSKKKHAHIEAKTKYFFRLYRVILQLPDNSEA
jgi:hypothetical protein